ncbi:MAG: hypothetical protein WCP55_08360 [Lentisphaerota bacterium]
MPNFLSSPSLLLRIAKFACGVLTRQLQLFSGEIHFAILGAASFLPRRMTGAHAGRKAVAPRPHSK